MNIGYAINTKTGISRSFSNLFPTVFIRKKLSDESNFRFSYNRRITRPAYTSIASAVTFNDIYSIILGNPSLRPVITDNLQTQFSYKQYLFTLQFSRDKNQIVDHQQTESLSDSLFYQMSHNLNYQQSLTLQTSFPVKITSWWKMQNSFSGGWKQFETNPSPSLNFILGRFKETFFLFNLYTSQNFELPRKIFIELSGFYASTDWMGMYKRKGFGVLNFGIKKDLKHNATIQLSIADLLRSTHYPTDIDVPQAAYSIRSKIDVIPESRRAQIFRLSYSKSFGNNKMKGKRRGDGIFSDEDNRVRKE
jgi:iron complex outermembrane recepter protein